MDLRQGLTLGFVSHFGQVSEMFHLPDSQTYVPKMETL